MRQWPASAQPRLTSSEASSRSLMCSEEGVRWPVAPTVTDKQVRFPLACTYGCVSSALNQATNGTAVQLLEDGHASALTSDPLFTEAGRGRR